MPGLGTRDSEEHNYNVVIPDAAQRRSGTQYLCVV
jgi:hypothetical protein